MGVCPDRRRMEDPFRSVSPVSYPGLRGTGLDNMNVIYGPEGFGSLPEGPANMQGTQGAFFVEEDERMPSVGKRNQKDATGESRIRSRIDQLGY